MKLAIALLTGILIGYLFNGRIEAGGDSCAWTSYNVRQVVNLLESIDTKLSLR
jgi:hypothetical protein